MQTYCQSRDELVPHQIIRKTRDEEIIGVKLARVQRTTLMYQQRHRPARRRTQGTEQRKTVVRHETGRAPARDPILWAPVCDGRSDRGGGAGSLTQGMRATRAQASGQPEQPRTSPVRKHWTTLDTERQLHQTRPDTHPGSGLTWTGTPGHVFLVSGTL